MDFAERVIPGITSNFMYRQARSRYSFAKKYIRNKDKVLDAACGTGYETIGVGIDNDPEAIAFAKSHYKAEFVVASVLDMPFESNSFDVVTSFETIEHVDANKFLTEVKKVLKRNGTLILSTPRENGPSNSPYHIKEFTAKELEILLKRYFKSVKLFGQGSSKNAEKAWNDFLISQESRQDIVDSDVLGIRKFFPKELKELIWRYFGNWFFKRNTQEDLTEKDFPIVKFSNSCQTLIAVCSR